MQDGGQNWGTRRPEVREAIACVYKFTSKVDSGFTESRRAIWAMVKTATCHRHPLARSAASELEQDRMLYQSTDIWNVTSLLKDLFLSFTMEEFQRYTSVQRLSPFVLR
jgi:hypothetical protein